MYYISKKFEFAASHTLSLDYDSKCSKLHGHNYIVEIFCKSSQLDKNGMVVDFKCIKEKVFDKLDHKHLNDILPFNPTSENIARWVCEQIPCCYKVNIQETTGNWACYEKD